MKGFRVLNNSVAVLVAEELPRCTQWIVLLAQFQRSNEQTLCHCRSWEKSLWAQMPVVSPIQDIEVDCLVSMIAVGPLVSAQQNDRLCAVVWHL